MSNLIRDSLLCWVMGMCNLVLANDVRGGPTCQSSPIELCGAEMWDDLHKSHIQKMVWINEAAYLMERLIIDKILQPWSEQKENYSSLLLKKAACILEGLLPHFVESFFLTLGSTPNKY